MLYAVKEIYILKLDLNQFQIVSGLETLSKQTSKQTGSRLLFHTILLKVVEDHTCIRH